MASASFISACIVALLCSAAMPAATAFCCRKSFCACTRRFCERGFGRLHLQLGVLQLLVELWIDELKDDAVGRDGAARTKQDPIDEALSRRRNPADVFGHQRAAAADFAEQRTPFDGVDPQRRALDAGSGRLQTRQAEGDQQNGDQRGSRRTRVGVSRF